MRLSIRRKAVKKRYDFVIAGAGFAGSLSAAVLARKGFDTLLLEKASHPRFAVGESSTPAADMILRSLAAKYDLGELESLSRYGSWIENHPELLCGLKRGFAYFTHAGTSQSGKAHRERRLLAAASSSDRESDTHWYRPHTDSFLTELAARAGADYRDHAIVADATEKSDGLLELRIDAKEQTFTCKCRWLIDATGSPGLCGELFGVRSGSESFRTDSHAVYTHFTGARTWQEVLEEEGVDLSRYPFAVDHSALHHLTNEGWIWCLRFRDGKLSAGAVTDRLTSPQGQRLDPAEEWRERICRYPLLKRLFDGARIADPPGRYLRTGRLQRKMQRVYGDNWIALNHTAGFVDPLHSTGIAHSLSGIERLLSMIVETEGDPKKLAARLQTHQAVLFREFDLIDLLVSGCYLSRRDFNLFHAFTSLYFVCSIAYEQERLAGRTPSHFLMADHPELNRTVRESWAELETLSRSTTIPKEVAGRIVDTIRERIAPWNRASLLDPEKSGLYEHTAVSLNDTAS